VPRNRDARAAVLGSSVQRAAAYGQSAVRLRAVRRRVVVVGLVLACLALVTLSFRSTALNPVEGVAASALRPFEIAANRVARPFRDATSWAHGLVNAKAENRRLIAANALLTAQVAQLKGQAQLASQLGAEAHYIHSPAFPSGFIERAAEVLSSPTDLDQSIAISAGSNNGLAPEDVVVSDNGELVGIVTAVLPTEARVMLITNPESNVRAVDESDAAAIGIVDHGVGSNTLIFDRIGKNLRVRDMDTIVTAGSPATGKFPSLFPRDIPIGSVSSVGQSDTQVYEDIQVQPFADLGSLETVLVLVPKS
jgi:rod shape-determining protein MreC